MAQKKSFAYKPKPKKVIKRTAKVKKPKTPKERIPQLKRQRRSHHRR